MRDLTALLLALTLGEPVSPDEGRAIALEVLTLWRCLGTAGGHETPETGCRTVDHGAKPNGA